MHRPEHNCLECRADPEKRTRWGCDAPTDEPQLWINPCPFCGGRTDLCEHCKGSNKVPIHRCINHHAGIEERKMVGQCALVEHGVLPDPGGWMDQAAQFTAAYPIVAREIEHWREVRSRPKNQPKR